MGAETIYIATHTSYGIRIATPFKYKATCQAIPDGIWDNAAWQYPGTPQQAKLIADAFAGLDIETDAAFDALLAQNPKPQPIEHPLKSREPFPNVVLEPFAHQVYAGRMIENMPGVMLDHDTGVGKTKSVIDAIVNLGIKTTLVVCTVNALVNFVWSKQLKIHAPGGWRYQCYEYIKGSVAKKAAAMRGHLELAAATDTAYIGIVNYAAVWRPAMARVICNNLWDLGVADEIQNIQSHKSKAGRMLGRAGRLMKRRVGLSGTPLGSAAGILGGWSICRFLAPQLFGGSFVAFRSRFAMWQEQPFPTNLGYRDCDEFARLWNSITHHVEKGEVLDLPPVTHITRGVTLEPKARKIYNDLEQHFIAEIDAGAVTLANVLTKSVRLQQATGGFLPVDLEDTGGARVLETIGTEKADALSELLSELRPEEPPVVFAKHHHDLDVIADAAKKNDRAYYELSGRRRQLPEWQSRNNSGDVLGVQIQAGGDSVDLTRASYCIYFSTGYHSLAYQQSLGRMDRKGQTRPVTYVHLVVRNSIDEKVSAALRQRKSVVDAILGMKKGE